MVAHGLANNGMTDEQRINLATDSDEYRLRSVGPYHVYMGLESQHMFV